MRQLKVKSEDEPTMKRYYVHDEPQEDSGDHEVHDEDCKWLPKIENRTYLGLFESCHGAVEEAEKRYDDVNGCIFCSTPCHTT